MFEWDAEAELQEAEADWENRQAALKKPLEVSFDQSSWKWASISAWGGMLCIPAALIFGDSFMAGALAVVFGFISLASLSSIKPDDCPMCKIYEQKIRLF